MISSSARVHILPLGFGRSADDDGFTLGCDRSLDCCFCDLKAGCLKWDKLRFHSGGNRAVEMVAVVGFKNEDAIAWLKNPTNVHAKAPVAPMVTVICLLGSALSLLSRSSFSAMSSRISTMPSG